LVTSHLQATQALASGLHALPGIATAFAATQAAYRFLNNDRIPLPSLAQPLLEAARQEASQACGRYLLVVHDWSHLRFAEHGAKQERVVLSSNRVPEGYELQTALLVGDRDGTPLAPGVMSLRAADGVHCSRCYRVRPAASPLDELEPAMRFLERQDFGLPLVHIIDAEADSVGHYRQWSKQAGRYFLVRADDRLVEHVGQEQRCSALREEFQRAGAFRQIREVLYRGQRATQWMVEIPVRLTRPAQRNRPGVGDRQRIAGPPLALRLTIVEVRDLAGRRLATWYLLTNLPHEVDGATIALWYYWRWSIETYFKLLKSAGTNVETWRQETPAAIARRLLVASMACVLVWSLARSEHPAADRARSLLIRLSGRQMKRGRPFTPPALLAGMWILLAMLDTLASHSLEELQTLAHVALQFAPNRPP
jgi:hypothetical protein